MKRVTGIGGIFFKSEDPDKLYQWYETHLGIRRSPDGTGAAFEWHELHQANENDSGTNDAARNGMTVWSIFPQNTKYFDPGRAGYTYSPL